MVSEIMFPRGRIVFAIYQSRCRTIKQRLGIRARCVPKTHRETFDFHDKAKYPVDVSSNDNIYSNTGVFLVAHGDFEHGSFALSLSFFSRRFAMIA